MKSLAKRSKKTGLPPGSLVHIGKDDDPKPIITILDYNSKKIKEKTINKIEEIFPFLSSKTVSWININGISSTEIIEKIGKKLDIHPLTQEDIMNPSQRPKLEEYNKYIYIVLRMFYYTDKGELISEQISLILGKTYVISFQEKEGDIFESLRTRIRSSKGQIRKQTADYLTYTILDTIVDNYFIVMESLGEEVEEIEEALIKKTDEKILQKIYDLKSELTELRKAIWALRETINKMDKLDEKIIKKDTKIFLRDVQDHSVQIIDTIETLRERSSNMMDIYLSSVSNKMNEVMKVLTVISTIFIPLTFITGLYGMNFTHMPEIPLKYSYPTVLGFMLILAIGMLRFFKKKKWI